MASFLQRNRASNVNTCSFGVGTTAGSFIIVGIFYDAAATLTSVTDGGDVATTIVAPTSDGAGTNYTCVAFLSAAAGRTTVTFNFTGSPAYYDIYIWEGAGLTNPVKDKTAFGQGTGLNADSGSTGTLTDTVELAISFGGTSLSYVSGGSGWTNAVVSGNGGIGEEQVTAATTALHGTGTTSSTGDVWVMLCATFMASSAAAISNKIYQTNFAVKRAAHY